MSQKSHKKVILFQQIYGEKRQKTKNSVEPQKKQKKSVIRKVKKLKYFID